MTAGTPGTSACSHDSGGRTSSIALAWLGTRRWKPRCIATPMLSASPGLAGFSSASVGGLQGHHSELRGSLYDGITLQACRPLLQSPLSRHAAVIPGRLHVCL